MASAHLTLHEAHCLLSLVLCPECKEPVPQAKMEEHCETGHQQVRRPKEGRAKRGVPGTGAQSWVLAAAAGLVIQPGMCQPPLQRGQSDCLSHTKLSLPLIFPSSALSLQAYGCGRGKGSLFQERLNVLFCEEGKQERKL